MFAADGELLYVGIAKSFYTRWMQHAGSKPWWPEVQRMTIDWHPTRMEAEDAESAAILAEQPKYNAQQKDKPDVRHKEQEPRGPLPEPTADWTWAVDALLRP